MTIRIGADLTSFAATLSRAEAPAPVAPVGEGFVHQLQNAIADVNAHQHQASQVSEAYANGDRNDLHGTMIALEQADITLRFAANVRNRLVEAYREVMRM